MRWINALVIGSLLATSGAALAQDNGDGTYTNPPLHADFPDPDIIRVGDEFFMVSSTFVNSPGLITLKSKDLINWETIGYVVDRLDGDPKYDLKDGGQYRNGVFAPSIRYRDGTFYVCVTLNGKNTRIYSAKDPAGPWKMSDIGESCFDPGLFFDDDGSAYIFTSGGWDGTVTLKTLSKDLDKVVASRKIFYFKGIEGTHVLKIGGAYYVFNALPGRLAFTTSRAKSLDGPWETIETLNDRRGGHQGAIVDLPDGRWYGFIMLDKGPIGRVTNISPITWQDGWPQWGEGDAVGKVPATAKMPIAGGPRIERPISSELDGPKLPLDWRWNHNPENDRWSMTERPGFLRLKPTVSDSLWLARNTLTHKGWGPTSTLVATLDVSNLKPGDRAGVGMYGKGIATLAVNRDDPNAAKLEMSTGVDGGTPVAVRATADLGAAKTVQLAFQMDFARAKGRVGFSTDGSQWTSVGEEFPLQWDWRTGTFQGEQYAVFCYSPKPSEGYVDVDSLRFPKQPVLSPASDRPAAQSR